MRCAREILGEVSLWQSSSKSRHIVVESYTDFIGNISKMNTLKYAGVNFGLAGVESAVDWQIIKTNGHRAIALLGVVGYYMSSPLFSTIIFYQKALISPKNNI